MNSWEVDVDARLDILEHLLRTMYHESIAADPNPTEALGMWRETMLRQISFPRSRGDDEQAAPERHQSAKLYLRTPSTTSAKTSRR